MEDMEERGYKGKLGEGIQEEKKNYNKKKNAVKDFAEVDVMDM